MTTDPTLSYRSAVTAVVMAVAGVTALMALLVFAGPWANAEPEAAPQETVVETVGQRLDAARTPAHNFLEAFTAAVGEGWDTSGLVPSALPPHPLVCGQPDLLPVTSMSVTVDRYAQVFVAVYPAGQGAAELDRQLATVDDCGGWSAKAAGPGKQAHHVFSTWDGKQSTSRVWRHGDVLAYTVVSQKHTDRLDDLTGVLDELLTGTLGGQCLAPQATVEDADRSPFHAPGGYVGFLLPEKVSIPAPDLPEPPEDPVVEVGEETATLDYEAFPFTAEEVEAVERPEQPSYPVWPELPEEREVPAAPEAPQAPPVKTTVDVAHEDVDGPGCGWAFTGELVPPFDPAKADSDRTAAVDHARKSLEDGAGAWQEAVSAYWQAWPTYLGEVAEYRTYAEEVSEVAAAWEVIAEQWRAYEEQREQWQVEDDAYRELVAQREAAQTQWDDLVAACEAAEEAESVTPEPDPTAGRPTPDEAPTVPGECEELERPAELDEPLPPAPVEPAEPEDPRP